MVTREELIVNLRETSEISHEIMEIENELGKKQALLLETVKESQQKFLKMVEEQYYQSEEYHCHYTYQQQIDQFKRNSENLMLLNHLMITIICGMLIYFGLPLFNAAIIWLITPKFIYFPYFLKKYFYVRRNKPKTTFKSIDVVLEEVQENFKLRPLSDSLLITYIKREIELLIIQKAEKEKCLSEITFLPFEYQKRESEILYLLENRKLDSLKEALYALDEADYLARVDQGLMFQLEEIRALSESVNKLIS